MKYHSLRLDVRPCAQPGLNPCQLCDFEPEAGPATHYVQLWCMPANTYRLACDCCAERHIRADKAHGEAAKGLTSVLYKG